MIPAHTPGLFSKVKQLAHDSTAAQLDKCTDEQVASGTNSCAFTLPSADDTLNVLAKAAYVRHLMEDKGQSEIDALRQLAANMRRAQGQPG